MADRSYRVPLATDEAYVTELLTICEAEQVRLVVPTIDDELPDAALAYVGFVSAALGVPVTLVGTGAAREHVLALG